MRFYRLSGIVLITILIICFFTTNAVAAVTWEKTFGGSYADGGSSVQQTTDGGYIICGAKGHLSEDGTFCCFNDIYLIKTDKNGNKVWEKTFGGWKDDWAVAQQTADGGYIIGGYTPSFGAGDADVYLIKTDDNGNKVWEKTFGGSSGDTGHSVQQTTDGGYIIGGSTHSFGAVEGDVYLIKTDGNGNKVWEKTFGGSEADGGSSVQQTSDGGYIIGGSTQSFGAGDADVYLIKTDDNGNKVWERTFGGNADDVGRSVQQTTDGGYIIGGYTSSGAAGGRDVYLIKTDNNGNKIWERTFGETDDDWGLSVQQTIDGGYIIAGTTESFGAGREDVYLIKTDDKGNKVWEKTFGGTSNDLGASVQQTIDFGYIIAGRTWSFGADGLDVYLIHYNPAAICVNNASELQSALTLAASNGKDDVIGIAQGTYNGNFVYTSTEANSLTLEGGYLPGCYDRVIDPTNTVLDAGGSGNVLVLSAPSVAANLVVDGLTLQNGDSKSVGGGLAILTKSGNVIISNNNIEKSFGDSGAVYIDGVNKLTITNNKIINNNYIGLYIVNCRTVKVVENIVSQNVEQGISIKSTGHIVEMQRNVITNHSGGNGGGLLIHTAPTVNLQDNIFEGNYGSAGGGGLWITSISSSVNLYNNIIRKNSSGSSAGGAWLGSWGNINMIGNVIVDNDASSDASDDQE